MSDRKPTRAAVVRELRHREKVAFDEDSGHAADLIEKQAAAIKGAAVIADAAGAEIRALKARIAELEARAGEAKPYAHVYEYDTAFGLHRQFKAATITSPSTDAARPEWADCESRGPMMRNSLKHRITELKSAAKKCRAAYRQDYMREPCEWIADAYDEAAKVMERRFAAISTLTKPATGASDADQA